MLGTARYLITRQDATDLFIFVFPQGNTAVIRKSRIDLSSYNTLWAFYGLLKALSSTSRRKRIMIGGGTLITNRTFFTLCYLTPAFLFKLFFSRSSDVYFFGVAVKK